MFWLTRAQRRHALAASLALSGFIAFPALAGEIFKCVAKDGTPLYQNFPCTIDSLGFLPSTPSAKAAQDQSLPAARAMVATAATKPTPTEVQAGMTIEDVRTLLGEPEEMIEEEPGVGGRTSNWRYADGKVVVFDHKHRVLGVQR